MEVYRLEHPKALGPYRGDFSIFSSEDRDILSNMSIAHSSRNEHPGAVHDGLAYWEELWQYNNLITLYGFLTRKDLIEWFRGYYKNLRRMGFRVVKYEVEEERYKLGKSGKQCIFALEESYLN